MEQLNRSLFLLLNAGGALHGAPLGLARFAANDLIFMVPILLVAGWLWLPRLRLTLLLAVAATLLALGINQVIGLCWFHPRPFMIGLGHTYLAHAPDSSFPSDHVTVLWTVGWTLCGVAVTRRAGTLLLLVAGIVAWARVFLGVHFPFDMLGAVAVATLSALVMRRFRPVLARRVLPLAERLYRALFGWAISRHWISD